MNKGGMFLGTLLLLFGGTAIAQSLSHQVLVPAAGVGVCATASLSQSVGENAVILLSSEMNDLTQGFQQPRIRIIPLDQPQGTGVKVYPVPATDFLNIEIYGETARNYSVSILDMSGKVVYLTELNYNESYWDVHTVPVSGFVRGLYFVRVKCALGKIERTFKISII